jgi:hypothetical protein
MLQSDETLDQLMIVYWPPVKKGWNQAFFVRGDGTAIKQAVPDRLVSAPDIPTCTGHLSVERVKALVRLIIQRRFLELPERRFIFLNGSPTNEEFETHTIGISDGRTKVSRSFAIGKFAGKQEVIPAEFAVIEEELKQITDSAFPPHTKDCRFAPAIKF